MEHHENNPLGVKGLLEAFFSFPKAKEKGAQKWEKSMVSPNSFGSEAWSWMREADLDSPGSFGSEAWPWMRETALTGLTCLFRLFSSLGSL